MHRSAIHRAICISFSFTVLFACILLIYRHGIFDLPRIDHLFFLKEQDFEKSPFDFFFRVISYNRSAHLASGDYFLYRPAFFGYLAIVTIFLRENLLLSGVLSLFWHAVVVWLAFILTKKVVKPVIALMLVSMFCVQYPGMEMFIWRHISPYMIGLISFFSGIILMQDFNESEPSASRCMAVGFLFFFSTLFHESFPFTLFGLSLMCLICGQRKFLPLFLIPCCLWAGFNFLDYLRYHPPSIFGSDQNSPFLTLQNSAFNIIFLAGIFWTVFYCPFLVEIEYESFFTERASWDPTTLSLPLVFLIGVVVLFMMAMFILGRIKKMRQTKNFSFDITFSVCVYFLILIIGFGIGRVSARTIDYLRMSTYYYYLASFCFVILTAGMIRWISEELQLKKIVGISFLFCAVLPYTLLNYQKLDRVLSERYPSDKLVAVSVVRMNQFLKSTPEFCYGGSFDHSFESVFADEIIYSHSCLHKKSKPLYLMPLDQPSHFTLAHLTDIDSPGTPLTLSSNLMEAEPAILEVINFGEAENLQGSSLMSRNEYDLVELSADIKRLSKSGVVIAFHDTRNFVALYGYQGQFLIMINRYGMHWHRWYRNKLIGPGDYIRFSVKRIKGGRIGFFCDNKIIELLPQGESLKGRIGFFAHENVPPDQLFKNISVMQVSDTGGSLFEFEPTATISIS